MCFIYNWVQRHEGVLGLWPRHYMEVSGQLRAPAALPQGKNPWYPSDRRLGGPQSRSGRRGEEKNFQPLPGLEPPIFQPVAQR
jgi:hypothetical protein